MKFFYKNIFYRLYRIAVAISNDETPEYTSLFAMSGIIFINFNFLFGIFNYFDFKYSIKPNLIAYISLSVLITLLNYIIIFKLNGVNKIIDDFRFEDNKQKVKMNIYVGLYILGSIILSLSTLGFWQP